VPRTATPVATRSAPSTPLLGARDFPSGNLGLFLVMSLIWGATWVAIKAGVTAIPPIFFASLRFGLVAAVLVIAVRDAMAPFGRDVVVRTVLTGLLINTGTYSLLFWGIQFVDSGVAGLINLSLIPIGLFVLSILIGDERPSWRHALSLALGTAGLFVLFSNGATPSGARMELWVRSPSWPARSAIASERCCRALSCRRLRRYSLRPPTLS
jgi:drug/metabolite transporter (DMT)-like permease